MNKKTNAWTLNAKISIHDKGSNHLLNLEDVELVPVKKGEAIVVRTEL